MDIDTAAEVYNRRSKQYEQYEGGMKLMDLNKSLTPYHRARLGWPLFTCIIDRMSMCDQLCVPVESAVSLVFV